MKPKELQNALGINANRIKRLKREGLFCPENPPTGNRPTEYTERDYERLKKITALTNAGFTCSDIRKMEAGDCEYKDILEARISSLRVSIERKQKALAALTALYHDYNLSPDRKQEEEI